MGGRNGGQGMGIRNPDEANLRRVFPNSIKKCSKGLGRGRDIVQLIQEQDASARANIRRKTQTRLLGTYYLRLLPVSKRRKHSSGLDFVLLRVLTGSSSKTSTSLAQRASTLAKAMQLREMIAVSDWANSEDNSRRMTVTKAVLPEPGEPEI